jgi:hypothetical protein
MSTLTLVCVKLLVAALPPKAADLRIYLPERFGDVLTVFSRLAPTAGIARATLSKPSRISSNKPIWSELSAAPLASLGCDRDHRNHPSIENIHRITAGKAQPGRTQ